MTPKVRTKTVSNAFNLLKEGQRKLSLDSVKYPEKMGSETNSRGDFRLYNDIIDLLQKKMGMALFRDVQRTFQTLI